MIADSENTREEFADKLYPETAAAGCACCQNPSFLFLQGLWCDQLRSSFVDPVITLARNASNHRNNNGNKLVVL
jgi:hypothetical protein